MHPSSTKRSSGLPAENATSASDSASNDTDPSRRFGILKSRWPWIAAAIVLAGYTLLAPRLERMQAGLDRRPLGTAQDIVALKERDDVNVLFILIDTLRADRLGAYGYERATSPLLDRIASRGVRFDHHLSQSSWTKCSMASLWTGLYPNRTGVTKFNEVVSEAARMPAEILSDAGFRTAGIFRNGWVMGYFGFNQGFDTYVRPFPMPVSTALRAENPTVEVGGSDNDATAAAIEFLRVNGHKRWFLYMHLMDLHEYLYSEDTAQFGTSYSDVYDNSILWVNSVLDPFFEELTRDGYLENTLIVITADHGEAFGERGFEGHARHVQRESTEIPLILSFPFRFEEPVVVENRTAGVDVWATIFGLLGIEDDRDQDGLSLVPEIIAAAEGRTPREKSDSRYLYSYLDRNWGRRETGTRPTLSVVDDTLRYVEYVNTEGVRAEEYLYDRTADPLELSNLVSSETQTVERMRAEAKRFMSESTPPFATQDRLEMDEMQLNQLRALGYSVP